jgi:hypothetical protein
LNLPARAQDYDVAALRANLGLLARAHDCGRDET